ncbi:uncharacterized protein LODBEIA_P17250 [Lodderomyces beijingensis]|uniref:HSF-type DNA-binding domain-containing protein n=1 Tax=Lodderomyces beijingensis TaxID=1775926 RepID=A0ABP0ZKT5_9ASCO
METASSFSCRVGPRFTGNLAVLCDVAASGTTVNVATGNQAQGAGSLAIESIGFCSTPMSRSDNFIPVSEDVTTTTTTTTTNAYTDIATTTAATTTTTAKPQITFVHKLYRMLHDNSVCHVIWWNEDGETFHIQADEELTAVLGKYFKHSNEQSFIRQLNMYGFHKINEKKRDKSTKKNNKLWDFRHSKRQFKKGTDEATLFSIKRRSTKNLNLQREVITLDTIPAATTAVAAPALATTTAAAAAPQTDTVQVPTPVSVIISTPGENTTTEQGYFGPKCQIVKTPTATPKSSVSPLSQLPRLPLPHAGQTQILPGVENLTPPNLKSFKRRRSSSIFSCSPSTPMTPTTPLLQYTPCCQQQQQQQHQQQPCEALRSEITSLKQEYNTLFAQYSQQSTYFKTVLDKIDNFSFPSSTSTQMQRSESKLESFICPLTKQPHHPRLVVPKLNSCIQVPTPLSSRAPSLASLCEGGKLHAGKSSTSGCGAESKLNLGLDSSLTRLPPMHYPIKKARLA